MPRIPDIYTDCSLYLYSSDEAARQGLSSGGSGFLVHVESEAMPSTGYLYAVTNKHLLDNGFGVLRLTTKMGTIETISTMWGDWFFSSRRIRCCGEAD
jgi:hypothetical protein